MVSIPACHAGDQGSIPWRGAIFKNQKIELELSSSLYQYFNTSITQCHVKTNKQEPQAFFVKIEQLSDFWI